MKLVCIFCTFVMLNACTGIDKRFINSDEISHPAMQVFLAYDRAIDEGTEFDEVTSYFSEADQKQIARTMGWHWLVYSGSHQALQNGSCDEIFLSQVTSSKVLVNCKGPFVYKSAFGFTANEKMHLRVYVNKVGDRWYIGKSGLTHTMPVAIGNEMQPRSIGLKFNN